MSTERLHQLSRLLTKVMEEHSEGAPEERFYLCSKELAKELQPRWAGQPNGRQDRIALARYSSLHGMTTGTKEPRTWPYVALAASEAEERWPSLILAGLLRPLGCQRLGTERATWSELLWGAGILTYSGETNRIWQLRTFGTEGKADNLAIIRWRARCMGAAHLGSSPIGGGTSIEMATNIDLAARPIRPRDISTILHIRDDLKRWTAAGWHEEGTLETATYFGDHGTDSGSSELRRNLQLVGETKSGYKILKEKAKRRRATGDEYETHIGWAPFPELGEGITMIAIEKDGRGMALTLIQEDAP